ncbi:MAG: putative LPS assembly protein LptD [Calditrichia bacterium]
MTVWKNRKLFFFWLALCGIVLRTNFLFAQAPPEVRNNPAVPDSLISTDTLKTLPAPEESGLEGPVKYRAETITFSIRKRTTRLLGDVHIEYQNITLDAHEVVIDWDQGYMTAFGRVDSTDAEGNVVKMTPAVFSEKGTAPINGNRLEYDFKNQRGKVVYGKTEMSPGYYRGQQIKKVGKKTLFVEDGVFTTCDSIDHPHYYFRASKMRIKVGKRAVARPIFLYIADIPLLGVPFGIFPMERGRRSGIIIPTYQKSSYGGNSLRGLGFYWAASEYWDATLLAHFYEKTGTAYEGELRYNKRYSFNGNIKARYAPKDVTTGQKRQRWSLEFRHNQNINQTTSISGNGRLVSDRTFLQNTSHNLDDRLNQLLSTNITFSKRWPNSKNSLTANYSRNENLQTGTWDYTFPRIRFNHSSSNLIKYKPGSGKKRWYHEIYYSYGSNFVRQGQKSQLTDSTYQTTLKSGWQHEASLSFNRKIFKYFKYRQSADFTELWVPEYRDYTWVDSLNKAVADTVKGFRSRHTFRTSVGISTTIYGLFELPFSPLKVIRHKMDPNISFSFAPDFTDPGWGYVQTFRDSTGKIQKYDRFTGNPYGGTSSSESRRMNISVSNLFQGKMIKNGEEKKVDLFNLNLSTSYDFLRDSLKWSDLHSRLQARISKDFDFNVSTVHSFYEVGHSGSGRRNEYVWEDGFALPRLSSVQFSARLHLAPPGGGGKKETPADTTQIPPEEDLTRDPYEAQLRDFKLPWDVTANFTYSLNRANINNVTKRFDANISARMELTRNWRIQYNGRFDLINKEITHQTFNIYRDLHCWEMSFSWSPNKVYSYFQLRIQVKESMLRDLKVTKTSSSYRTY